MYQQLIELVKKPFTNALSSYDSLDQKIISFLGQTNSKPYSFSFESAPSKDLFCKWNLWRSLLKAILLAHFDGTLKKSQRHLKESWYDLVAFKSLDHFQLEIVYAKLTAYFLNIEEEMPLECKQQKNGLCPLFSGDHWTLLNTPFIDQHAEFATLLILIGKLLNQTEYVDQGCKAAYWHIQNTDSEFMPYRGFLTNHGKSSFNNIVLKQALLFHAASLANQDKEMAFLAKKHFSFLLNCEAHQLKDLSLETLLIWRLVDSHFKNQLTPEEPKLSQDFCDDNLPICGKRTDKINVLCSLAGHNASMGTLRFGDLQIAAFGPQIETLGDGAFFGFIDGLNKENGYESKKLNDGFMLKSTVGLPQINPEVSASRLWEHPFSWLETKIIYEKDSLKIQLKPLRTQENVYFVFYVMADQCLIKDEKKVLYHSLEQFQGRACNVSFLNQTKMMSLDLVKSDTSMKIIPLEGGKSFWGANYLIAYHLNKEYSIFEWKVICSHR